MSVHVRNDRGTSIVFLNRDDKSFLDREVFQRMNNTSDMPKIRSEGDQLVFVYGTLKRGHYNHFLLRNAQYLGRGRSMAERYEMFDAGFPVLREVAPDTGYFVFGEVFACNADTMMDLDRLESNGEMYNRKKIPIKMFQQDKEDDGVNSIYPIRDCWTYFGDEEYWNDMEGLPEIQGTRVFATQPEGVEFLSKLRQTHIG